MAMPSRRARSTSPKEIAIRISTIPTSRTIILVPIQAISTNPVRKVPKMEPIAPQA